MILVIHHGEMQTCILLMSVVETLINPKTVPLEECFSSFNVQDQLSMTELKAMVEKFFNHATCVKGIKRYFKSLRGKKQKERNEY